MHKTLLYSLILFLLPLAISLADEDISDDQARLDAAKRYVETVPPMSSLLNQNLLLLKNRFPDKDVQRIQHEIEKTFGSQRIEELMIKIFAKHLTVAELNALANFYGSPIGKSIMNKFGPTMADFQFSLYQEMENFIKEIESR